MPLIKGKSQKSFVKNMKTEMEHGKPQKQSLAIAYAMKRKAQHKAKGGLMQGSGQSLPHYDEGGLTSAQASMQSAFGTPKPKPSPDQGLDDKYKQVIGSNKPMGYASGGQITDNYQPSGKPHVDKEFAHEPAEFAHGYMSHEGNDVKHNSMAMHEDDIGFNQHAVDMAASTSMSEQDLVDRIMEKRSMDYSSEDRYAKGGSVKGVHESSMGIHSPKNKMEKKWAGSSYAGDSATEMTDDEPNKGHNEDMKANAMDEHHRVLGEMKAMPNPKIKGLSEGGKVANQEHGYMDEDLAGFSPNEFDDLVLDDDLSSTYGEDDNAGDALGNKQEDHDRNDIVARIMKSRKKKDRMPNPA